MRQFVAVIAALMTVAGWSCRQTPSATSSSSQITDAKTVDLGVKFNALTPERIAVHVFPQHDPAPAARDPRGLLFSSPAAAAASETAITTANPLTYHRGPLMLHARIVNVLWGNWASATAVANRVAAFERILGRSGEYAVITQYGNTAGEKIALTDLSPTTVSFANGATGVVKNAQVVASLQRLISQKVLPAPTPDLLYVVLLAPGIASSTSDGWSSCNSGLPGKKYCGYHSHFFSQNLHAQFAVIVYPSCRGCQGHPIPNIPAPAAGITPIVEHETREAATDKYFNGWYNSAGEADDICNWDTFVDGGYQHQREWSNAAMKCVAKGINGP
jgi:hypothetical protein